MCGRNGHLALVLALGLIIPLIGLSGCRLPAFDRATEFYDKGVALERQGDLDAAIAAYSKAIELVSDYGKAYTGRGRAYHATKKWDLAMADYNRAIELNPEDMSRFFNRALTYEAIGAKDLAAADYTRVAARSKDAGLTALATGRLAELGRATSTPVPVVAFPAAIPGDPPFTSSSGVPTRTRIGPFATQPGDYFVSYIMTDSELSAYWADYHAPIRQKILQAVQDNFRDSVDVVIVILDADQAPRADFPAGVNYHVQSGSVHNPATSRFGRLGNLWLTTRRSLVTGPALHELLHGFHNSMAEDDTANFIIPTVDSAHWGFSSAGGQLGGWDRNTLVSLGDGTYQARPPLPPGRTRQAAFGLHANGGNSIPYSNLELWSMGLIPDSELEPVDVALNASFIEREQGKFRAEAIRTYLPAEIVARTIPGSRPSTGTARAFRGLVVLASTRTALDAATITQLNSAIQQFSGRAPSPYNYNFWTATGMRASLQLARASELAR